MSAVSGLILRHAISVLHAQTRHRLHTPKPLVDARHQRRRCGFRPRGCGRRYHRGMSFPRGWSLKIWAKDCHYAVHKSGLHPSPRCWNCRPQVYVPRPWKHISDPKSEAQNAELQFLLRQGFAAVERWHSPVGRRGQSAEPGWHD